MKNGKEALKAAVGARIKELRESKGVKQCYLALYTGKTKAFLSAVENGKCFPSLYVLLHICAALEVEPGTILDGFFKVEEVVVQRAVFVFEENLEDDNAD